MSRHSMTAYCRDCGDEEFSIDLEHFTKDTLIMIANNTFCPKCQSDRWHVSDGCER